MGDGRASKRSARVAVAIGVLVPLAVVGALLQVDAWRNQWDAGGTVVAVLTTHLLVVAVAGWGGAILVHRRPGNVCGWLAIAFAAAIGAWYVAAFAPPYRGWWPFAPALLVLTLRPLLLWLVLAWPTGRLDRPGRWIFAAALAASAVYFVVDASSADWADAPTGLWQQPQLRLLIGSLHWDAGLLVLSAAVLITCWRRRLRLRGSALTLTRPGWWAAVALAAADLVLVLHGPLRDLDQHQGVLTPFGMGVQVIDLAARGAVIVLLVWGARQVWISEGAEAAIDLDEGGPSVEDTLRAATGDPTAELHLDVDSTTDVGRASMTIALGGEPIAVLHHADDLVAHPALLESAAAVVATQLVHARLAAEAEVSAATLRRLGREVLQAEDDARRRLERDLHDGAQSALVGTALQASLLASRGAADGEVQALAETLDGVRESLLALATGRPPALLAQRGLSGAIGALAATAGLPVTVQVDPCDDLDAQLQRTLWFLAGDAVSNSLKHSGAASLAITLERRRADVQLTVRDDGRGGLVTPPASLRERADAAGGQVRVTSDPGAGTTVEVTVPIGVLVPA